MPRIHYRSRDYERVHDITPQQPRARRPKTRCPCGCGQRGLCDSHKARLREISERLGLRFERSPSNRRKDGRV
jgi:hypothetical protein